MPVPQRERPERIARRIIARPVGIRPRDRRPRLRQRQPPFLHGKPARIQNQKRVPATRRLRDVRRDRDGTRRQPPVAAPKPRAGGFAVHARKLREKILRGNAAFERAAKAPQQPASGTRDVPEHGVRRRRERAAAKIGRKRIRKTDCPKLRHRAERLYF